MASDPRTAILVAGLLAMALVVSVNRVVAYFYRRGWRDAMHQEHPPEEADR